MFKIIDVIFRPVEHLPYDDFIYVKMLDGIEGNGFHVPVRATIDKLILEAPSGLDFGYCPTHQVTTKLVDSCLIIYTYIHKYINKHTHILLYYVGYIYIILFLDMYVCF